jgi:adenylate cyclase
MEPTRIDRKLTAILSADVKGYSRLMGEDEVATIRTLTAYRELITSLIREHKGRVVDTPGDNLLADFVSVVDSVQCAVRIQQELTTKNAELPDNRKMEFRIGINLGDVIVDGERIYGDGVNIAARVESLAEGGGICTSGTVYEQIKNKLALGYESLGEHTVKNIAEPVQVYRINLQKLGAKPLELPTKPSIAVLPFKNLSGDPEQDYFSDGITEDIITALSRIRQFFVIAGNSTFADKGTSPDVRQVSKELGARYILEGSVQRAASRVRISAQLIEGTTGNHVWAERYDRDLEDVFAVQDEITQTVVGAIEPELLKSELHRARIKPPENLHAQDCYYRGVWHLNRRTKEDFTEARRLFERATELDPNYGPAYAGIVENYYYQRIAGYTERDSQRAFRAARKAVELDDEDSNAHLALGRVYHTEGDTVAAIAEYETAIQLNPSSAWAYHNLGSALIYSGRAEEAIPHLHSALRLCPKDTLSSPRVHGRLSAAHLYLKQHEEAVASGMKATRKGNISWVAWAYLVSALGHLGRTDEARRVHEDLNRRYPDITLTLTFAREQKGVADPDYLSHFLEGLRKAGVPE